MRGGGGAGRGEGGEDRREKREKKRYGQRDVTYNPILREQ